MESQHRIRVATRPGVMSALGSPLPRAFSLAGGCWGDGPENFQERPKSAIGSLPAGPLLASDMLGLEVATGWNADINRSTDGFPFSRFSLGGGQRRMRLAPAFTLADPSPAVRIVGASAAKQLWLTANALCGDMGVDVRCTLPPALSED